MGILSRRVGAGAMVSILLLLALFAVSCSKPATSETSSPEKYPYLVTTTVGMVSDIVRQVAGDHARVEGLIGEGVDL